VNNASALQEAVTLKSTQLQPHRVVSDVELLRQRVDCVLPATNSVENR
jgi:hypothetical protein